MACISELSYDLHVSHFRGSWLGVADGRRRPPRCLGGRLDSHHEGSQMESMRVQS